MQTIDLIGNTSNCKSGCTHQKKTWGDWINSSRPFGNYRYDGDFIRHANKPALIHVPDEYSNYQQLIGCKGRNMINKAIKNGYAAKKIHYNDYLPDIYLINTSKPMRQGRPMANNYMVMPKADVAGEYCEKHYVQWYGVIYKDTYLVAYANVSVMNEFAIINQILGHSEHLKFGIMNLLIASIVKDLTGSRVKFINYLTLSGCKDGLKSFKESVGFIATETKFKKNL